MSETEQVISIGEPMPRLASVACHGAYEIVVGWAAGSTREHNADLVDLAPLILTYKLYRPLRDNPDLLKTVHMIEGGSAIAWGVDDAIDMAATSIERLAEEQMSSADFRAWLESRKFTYDAAAAQLGISRRLVGYYADQRPVPRYIALACRYLDLERAPKASPDEGELSRLACRYLVKRSDLELIEKELRFARPEPPPITYPRVLRPGDLFDEPITDPAPASRPDFRKP